MKYPYALAAVIAVAGLALTGCTAAPVTATTAEPVAAIAPTATPTPTSVGQAVATLNQVAGTLSPEKQDALYLAGTRSQVTTGTDAALIAIGHKTCDDFAAGVDMNTRVDNIVKAGYAPADTLAIILSAGVAYCKAQ